MFKKKVVISVFKLYFCFYNFNSNSLNVCYSLIGIINFVQSYRFVFRLNNWKKNLPRFKNHSPEHVANINILRIIPANEGYFSVSYNVDGSSAVLMFAQQYYKNINPLRIPLDKFVIIILLW